MLLEKDISEREILKAIGQLTIRKSPGSDSLTPEFYKRLKNSLGEELVDNFKQIDVKNELPATMGEGKITCIYQKGDRTRKGYTKEAL